MSRARRQFTEGLMADNPWKMGFGVLLGLVGVLRKARQPQPEIVERVTLRPGQAVQVSLRDPRPGETQRKVHRRGKRRGRARR